MVMIVAITVCGFYVLMAAALFCAQEKMIYHPRSYGFQLNRLPPDEVRVLRFETRCGHQAAFYVPPKSVAALPERIWVMFHGNASLALDWLDILEKSPDPAAGYLLVDYPGYGECEGSPSPKAILENAEKAMAVLAQELKTDGARLYGHLRIYGYSLGAAAALQLACHHEVERVVLVSPFTSMLEMARRIVGWPLCTLLTHRYDNRSCLAELARRPQRPRLVIFHGEEDGVIPIQMSRELCALVPGWAEFHAVPGADHIYVLDMAAEQIRKALGAGE